MASSYREPVSDPRAESRLAHPPKTTVAFRVGVVGHRPNRLPEDEAGLATISERVRVVLETVKSAVDAFRQDSDAEFYAPAPPILRAISPLAEGSDRVFAELALDLGFELCSPMPFARDEYERDFEHPEALEDDSLLRFRAILDRAQAGAGLTVFELDGSRDELGAAYGAAGRLVLNQSDLLLAIWDGEAPAGPGGTVDTLRDAAAYNVPVIWINARSPYGWALVRDTEDLEQLDALVAAHAEFPDEDGVRLRAAVKEVVTAELRMPETPPEDGAKDEARRHARDYFREGRPPINAFVQWKYFRNLIGLSRFRWFPLAVAPFVDQIRDAWPVTPEDVGRGAPPSPVMAQVNAALRGHYAWADKRADLYADAHRSTNIITSLFAASAVFLALAPMALGWGEGHEDLERGTIILELLILVLIVVLNNAGHVRRWHSRWLEYRVVAELVRQLRLLLPLGGGRPAPRAPAHLATYGDPTRSWMYWHIRAIARAVGIPNARVTPDYAVECLDDLYDIADGPEHGQLAFHRTNHHRSHTIHERLHLLTNIGFWTTIVGVLSHFALTFLTARHVRAGHWLLLISAVAPAFGAALANINNQGEFARLAKRSRAMEDGFGAFARRIRALRGELIAKPRPLAIEPVIEVARGMTEMMVEENVDWRVVVLDIPHAGG